VRGGDDVDGRAYNLKRHWKVAHQGYEAVLNRKKRIVVRQVRGFAIALVLLLLSPSELDVTTAPQPPRRALATHCRWRGPLLYQ
jgi:hypothetical protein